MQSISPITILLGLIASIVPVATAFAQSVDAPTVIVLVRHAEKGTGDDPPLSDAGKKRAAALVDAVGGADVAAIYTTQYRRTRETAEPLARKLGIDITAMPVNASNAASYASLVAADIAAKHRGKTVVVVGHGNTIPALAEWLSGAPAPQIAEEQFDRIFIVIVPASGKGRVITARYGAASEG